MKQTFESDFQKVMDRLAGTYLEEKNAEVEYLKTVVELNRSRVSALEQFVEHVQANIEVPSPSSTRRNGGQGRETLVAVIRTLNLDEELTNEVNGMLALLGEPRLTDEELKDKDGE